MFQPTFSRISYLAYRFRQFRRCIRSFSYRLRNSYYFRHCHFCGAYRLLSYIGYTSPRGWGEGDMQPRNVPVCHCCYHK